MSAGDSSRIGRPVERLEDEALLRGDGRSCAAGDYAIAMAVVVLHVGARPPTGAAGHDNDERVAEARIAIGATVDRHRLLPAVSARVQGHALDAKLAREAGAAAAASRASRQDSG